MDEIGRYAGERGGYNLSRAFDEIRTTYQHVESCREIVPEAITIFLKGKEKILKM